MFKPGDLVRFKKQYKEKLQSLFIWHNEVRKVVEWKQHSTFPGLMALWLEKEGPNGGPGEWGDMYWELVVPRYKKNLPDWF